MKGKPYDWNIVLLGAWNLAILTPEGISKRLFGLPPGTPIEVQVALDQLAPLRVVVGQIMVIPSKGMLLIQPITATLPLLADAAHAAIRVLRGLPETPVRAAGVNFRYRFDPIPQSLQNSLDSSIDPLVAEADFSRVSRQMKRTLKWREQLLNLDIKEDEGAASTIEFNFHNPATDCGALADWLGETSAMAESVSRLRQVLELQVEEEV